MQMFSKVFIYVDYLVNIDFISLNLCENRADIKSNCNGKCHLKKELLKEQKQSETPTNPIKEKNDIQFFKVIEALHFCAESTNANLDVVVFQSDSEKHLRAVFQPPQV